MPNTAVAQDADAVFAAGLATLGSGFSQLFLIDRNEIGDWVRTAVTGGFAHAVVGAIDHFLRDVIAMPPDQASLCFVCDTQFGRGALPVVVGLLVPTSAEATGAGGFGFCRGCARRARWRSPGWQQHLAELAVPRFREIWPDFRVGDALFDVDLASGTPVSAGRA